MAFSPDGLLSWPHLLLAGGPSQPGPHRRLSGAAAATEAPVPSVQSEGGSASVFCKMKMPAVLFRSSELLQILPASPPGLSYFCDMALANH